MLIWYALVGYILGSIPSGLLIGRIWNIDIRDYGSGNIGTANVYRTLGPLPSIFVFLLDFSKGFLAIYLAYWAGGDPRLIPILAVTVMIGNIFPVFLGLRGGKGAATGLGIISALSPLIFLCSIILAVLIIFITRYVSLASILIPFIAGGLMFALNHPLPYTLTVFAGALLILWAHRSNIKRLFQGNEPRIGEKS